MTPAEQKFMMSQAFQDLTDVTAKMHLAIMESGKLFKDLGEESVPEPLIRYLRLAEAQTKHMAELGAYIERM